MHFTYLFLLLTFSSTLHDIETIHDLHLSRTDIIYNPETDAFEITMNIFIDDLEAALDLQGHQDLYLCTDREVSDADSLIALYLTEHLMISSGSNTLPYQYLGKEVNEDLSSVWCYMEILSPDISDDISVEMDLFNELFDDQKNIVKLQYDTKHKDHYLLSKSEKTAILSIL